MFTCVVQSSTPQGGHDHHGHGGYDQYGSTTSTAVMIRPATTNLHVVVVSSMEAIPISITASADSKISVVSQRTVPQSISRVSAASRVMAATDWPHDGDMRRVGLMMET